MIEQSNRLAVSGGVPVRARPYPSWPVFDDAELSAVAAVVASREWWRRDGVAVRRFEAEFGRFHEARYVLAIGSGTQALEIALGALDIGEGDEVIVPAMTFTSSVTAVLQSRAIPIIADVDPLTWCLDPGSVRSCLSARTRAVIPVHLSGHPVNMDGISALARPSDLAVIEDCAQAHGAAWHGRRVGALGACGVFSFQQGKLMTSGEGGCFVTDVTDLHARAALLSNCGRLESDRVYDHQIVGTNARMTEMQAAMLSSQLARFEAQAARRAANYATLAEGLSGIRGVTLQGHHASATEASHYMVMLLCEADMFGGLTRDQLVAALNAEGIPALRAYRPVHQLPFMVNRRFGSRWRGAEHLLPDYAAVRCPVAERVGDFGVCLPHRLLLGDRADVLDVVVAFEKVQRCGRRKR
jgi:3-amino-5-hydroxybenzoate synthase